MLVIGGIYYGRELKKAFASRGKIGHTNGGDTVSTEAVAARRHAGPHLPAIG